VTEAQLSLLVWIVVFKLDLPLQFPPNDYNFQFRDEQLNAIRIQISKTFFSTPIRIVDSDVVFVVLMDCFTDRRSLSEPEKTILVEKNVNDFPLVICDNKCYSLTVSGVSFCFRFRFC